MRLKIFVCKTRKSSALRFIVDVTKRKTTSRTQLNLWVKVALLRPIITI